MILLILFYKQYGNEEVLNLIHEERNLFFTFNIIFGDESDFVFKGFLQMH